MNQSWSYSQWSDAVKCQQYYKLCYIDKIVPAGQIDGGDMAFGTALHSALHAELQGDDGADVFTILWDLQKDVPLSYSRFKWSELKVLGLEFVRKYKKGHGKKMLLIQGEKRLYADYKGVKLEGTADFVGTYDGVPTLIDFKTSAYTYHKDRASVSLQLHLYAYLAIQNNLPKPKTLQYLVFSKATSSIQLQTWAFDKSLMYSMLDNMVEYANMVMTANTYPRNPNQCVVGTQRCKYFDTCWKGR